LTGARRTQGLDRASRDLALAVQGRAQRHEIGLDHILWGNDYPHYEGTFPNNRKTLRHTMHDMPDSERRLILGENAAKLYKFDLAQLKPIVERCGPTPEEISRPTSLALRFAHRIAAATVSITSVGPQSLRTPAARFRLSSRSSASRATLGSP